MQTPLISVILPVYNAEDFIGEAIQSILNQTYTNFELIILHDGSNDNTLHVIQQITDPRIILVNDGQNKGLVHRLNQGIDLAKGQYIARMDADDISTPDRFEKQVNILNNQPEIGIVSSWFKLLGGSNKVIKQPISSGKILFSLLYSCPVTHPAVMLRAELLNNARYHAEFFPVEDYHLWYMLSDKTFFYNIPEVLLHYRVHNQSVSKLQQTKQDNMTKGIMKMVYQKYFRHSLSDNDFNMFQLLFKKKNTQAQYLYQVVRQVSITLQYNQQNGFFKQHELTQYFVVFLQRYIRNLNKHPFALLKIFRYSVPWQLPLKPRLGLMLRCILPFQVN